MDILYIIDIKIKKEINKKEIYKEKRKKERKNDLFS